MINVKTKSQDKLHRIQVVPQRTTFKVVSRSCWGPSTAVLALVVPKAGKVIADGSEIKRVGMVVRKESHVRVEVQLRPFARRAVERHGRIKANVRLNYVPRGGHAITKTVPVIFG
jgi:hypothetical protein